MKARSTHYALRATPDAWETTPSGKQGQSLRLGTRSETPGEFRSCPCAVQSPFSGHVPRLIPALAFLAVLVFTAGCGTACRCCRPQTTSIASAPERVEIGGREYTLAASAWRDFQPVAPPNGQPLVVVIKVSPSDMMPLPNDIAIDHVWVLNGKEQWPAAPAPGATGLETAVRNGPKWGPGIKVDVVARLKQGKKTFIVRAAGVEVKRTD